MFSTAVLIGVVINFLPGSSEDQHIAHGANGVQNLAKPNQQPATTSGSHRLSIVSCIACHGSKVFTESNPESNEPSGLWKSAYQIWSSQDPHSNAYTTLNSAQSQQIVKALAASDLPLATARELTVENDSYQAILNQRCVSCHSSVPPDLAKETATLRGESVSRNSLYMSNGVNCHSCHSIDDLHDPDGNSWIQEHVMESWTTEFDEESSGLANLKDLKVRSQTCVKCHVGSQDRDVNHDLIAAGHPRLVFEFSSHLSRLPKHWNEPASRGFHIECWSTGNLVAAESTLRLLDSRVQLVATENGAWPEFSEYNCHNCHHDLSASWYESFVNKEFGVPTWGTWAFPNSSSNNVNEIRAEMQKPFPKLDLIQSLLDNRETLGPISSFDHVYSYLEQSPQLNSDEIYNWYLAVQACLKDFPADDQIKSTIRPSIKRLEEILVAPFMDRSNNKADLSRRDFTSEEVRATIAEIQQMILPALQNQRDRLSNQ